MSSAREESELEASWIRWAIPALIYIVFLSWYGGSGDPLSSDEIEDYLTIAAEQRADRNDSESAEGESVQRESDRYRATGNTALPRPIQRPHPPLWVGGNSRMAIRRAAASAQGWSPFPVPAAHAATVHTSAIETHADLADKIDYLRRYCAEIGRDTRVSINFVPFGHGMNSSQAFDYPAFREEVAELGALGVDWLSIGVPGNNRASYIESIHQFGAELIA